MKYFKNISGIILVICLSIFSILPFFSSGFFSMHDDTQVARVFEMSRSLSDGMFPVRWVSDLGYGYGYPIFNFYSPFPYYLGGILNLLGLNVLLATKIVFIIGALSSGLFAYLFVQSFLGKNAALVSAVAYTYFPYHAVNIYVRGALGELYGYALLPLIFWGFYKLHYLSSKNQFLSKSLIFVVASVSLALIIISHNLSAFMLILFLAVFILLSLFNTQHRKKLIASYVLVLIFGFMLSAFYSIPALSEMKYTNVFSQIGGGAAYSDHFVCPLQLWDSPWGYGGSAKGCVDGMSFRLGKIFIIVALLSILTYLYLLIKKKVQKSFFVFTSFIFLIFSIFLTLDWSGFIWNKIALMAFLQYPWRFLNFAGLFISVACGILIFNIYKLFGQKAAKLISVFLVFLILFFNIKLFKPQFVYNYDPSYYTNISYLNWNVSKISDEYMPKDFSKPKDINEIPKQKIELVNSAGRIENLVSKTGLVKANLNLSESAIVKINIAYFPEWKIFLNNIPVRYEADKDGLYLSVPKGLNVLEARLSQTEIERLSNLLSVIGVFILFLAIMVNIYNRNYDKKTS